MTRTSDFEQLLRATGLRVTRPRVAVLGAVDAHPHSDTESIIGAVRGGLPEVSHQAVYDSLHTLTAADQPRLRHCTSSAKHPAMNTSVGRKRERP